MGAFLAGLIIAKVPDGSLRHYSLVRLCGIISTLLSPWLAGRLQPASKPRPQSEPLPELPEILPAAEAF